MKKELPFKNNVNKSTSMNKHLDNSMIGNYDSVNNTTFQPHNLQNEFNSIKTNKGRNGVAEKKLGREPRNLSMNKNKGQPSNLRKEVSNEKKGKFMIQNRIIKKWIDKFIMSAYYDYFNTANNNN